MKKRCLIMMACLLAFAIPACGSAQNDRSSAGSHASQNELSDDAAAESVSDRQESAGASPVDLTRTTGSNALIVYFSHTGTTEAVAMEIQTQTGADLFEIIPETPYVDDYNTLLEIAREEQNRNDRPAFTGRVAHFEEYDTIYLGYPVWHGTCPMIVFSFLEAYDFTGKTVLPFCTSGSSGIARSMDDIREICGSTTVSDGLGLSGTSATDPHSAIRLWLNGPDSPGPEEGDSTTSDRPQTSDNIISLQIGENTLTATLTDNSSAEALKDLLAQGPVTIDMRDYGNMEKVGELDRSLPTNDEQMTTEPGDLVLYQGNSFVIYYAPNSWSLTRLGKINDTSAAELKEVLGSGNVAVTLSLNRS